MVSIIVPAYNVAGYIGQTIESILNQDYNDFELIIIDDGSTDGTIDVVNRYVQLDYRIRLVQQPNGGAARARNKGIALTKGEFIIFVDGDDVISNDFISSNIGYFSENPNLDWVAMSIKRVDKDCNPINIERIYKDLVYDTTKVINRDLFVPMFAKNKLSGVCCGAIYRKKSIEMISFPDGDFYEDGFFFTDLLTYTTIGMLSSQGVYYYIHRENSSQLKKLDKAHLISDLRCSQKRLRQYRIAYPEYEDIYQNWENNLYYYYKNECAKGTEGSKEIFDQYKSKLNRGVPFKVRHEIKFLIYRLMGYNRLKSIVSALQLRFR